MRTFLVASGIGVSSLVLFGAVLVQHSDARGSAPTCAEYPSQQSNARCTSLQIPKSKPKPKKNKEPVGPRCPRSNEAWDKSGRLPNAAPDVELKASVGQITLSCKSGTTPTACASDAKVQLTAQGSDADGDPFLVTYSVTGGRITGDGADAVWDLSNVEAGNYRAIVEIDDGCGCINFADTTVAVVACPDCNPE
jgi:hypothetical protein